MSFLKHEVSTGESGLRIDQLLVSLNESHSRSSVQRWIKNEFVLVNNQFIKANYRVRSADLIQWKIPQKKPQTIEPENIPLHIIYEDDALIVLNKQQGMIVHPTPHSKTGTVVNGLLFYTDKLASLAGEERPGIVHRLDKDTGGLLVVAKTNAAYKSLVQQFKQRTVTRKYKAMVQGKLKNMEGTINAPIGRHPQQRKKMAVVREGREAITHFCVLEQFWHYTLVKCQLETGRTHQLRVHLAHIGHPIVGDPLYKQNPTECVKGQLLFAYHLAFLHPITGEPVRFFVENPPYINNFINKVRERS